MIGVGVSGLPTTIRIESTARSPSYIHSRALAMSISTCRDHGGAGIARTRCKLARAQVRDLRIEQQGEARVRLRAEPSAGDKVAVERNLPKGQRRYRNLDIKVSAEARLARDRSQPGE